MQPVSLFQLPVGADAASRFPGNLPAYAARRSAGLRPGELKQAAVSSRAGGRRSGDLAATYPEKVRALGQVWLKPTAAISALAKQDLPVAPSIPTVDPNALPKTGQATAATNAGPAFTLSAAKLKLKPGMAAEYQRRHNAIWPELAQAIHNADIRDDSIFLNETTPNSLRALRP